MLIAYLIELCTLCITIAYLVVLCVAMVLEATSLFVSLSGLCGH